MAREEERQISEIQAEIAELRKRVRSNLRSRCSHMLIITTERNPSEEESSDWYTCQSTYSEAEIEDEAQTTIDPWIR